MALQSKTYSTGSFAYGGESRGYILDLILTEEAINAVANTSQISYKLQLRSGSSNRFNWEFDSTISLNGSEVASSTDEKELDYNSTWVLLSGTATIPHDDDGTLSMSYLAKLTPWNGGTKYTPPTLTVSGSMELTNIPRASTISATGACIGDASTVTVDRKSTQFTHSIRYQFGSLSGYISSNTGTLSATEIKLTATTIVLPIPASFYNQIPNTPSAVCTLTCKTYSGNTQIGDAKTATFNVTADPARCGPVVSATAKDINTATLKLTGNEKIFVAGRSDVQCAISAQGRGGANIKEIYVNGVKTQNNPYTISGINTASIIVRVVDSRGYPKEYTIPGLSLVPYVPLSFFAEAERTDPTSGDAAVTISGKWYAGSFGAMQNALTAQYQVNGGQWISFSPDAADGNIQAQIFLSELNYLTTHNINVKLSDHLATITKKVVVQKGTPVFDWGENDFRFHVPVSIMGNTFHHQFTTMEDVDSLSFNDSKFHLGYGIVKDGDVLVGYVCFYIAWIALQFKVHPGGAVYKRAKYGDSAWTSWAQI